MKKYVGTIVVIGTMLIVFLMYSGMKVEKENMKIFEESGYILQGMEENNKQIERYYFTENQSYKEKYNTKIEFQDTNGQKVVTTNDNFIHYTNGSISALKNGVLMDLNSVDSDPICYYNISTSKELKKSADVYKITNLGKELQFNNVIWKISDNKYLIAGSKINLVFSDGTNKEINGYIELEYADNEIVRIYNQEITCQTISSDVYIEIPEEIKINISNKVVSKNGENQMSLNSMVIDSNDNVTITDLNEYNEEKNVIDNTITNEINNMENEQQKHNSSTSQSGGSTSTSSGSQTTINTQNTIIQGTIMDEEDGKEQDEVVEIINPPTFRIENFETTSIGLNASIVITDDESLLTSDTTIKIIKKDNGKTIYETTAGLGEYNISVELANLLPNTDYTFVVEATYKIDEFEYNKDFIYKGFRTSHCGVSFEKDAFTNDSMSFNVIFDANSKVKGGDFVVLDEQNNILVTEKVANTLKTKNKVPVTFKNLQSNTGYTVQLTNIIYDGQVLANGFELSSTYKTLKQKPQISGVAYEINKRDGNFVLRLNNAIDVNSGITGYKFQIYDTRETENIEPIMITETMKPEVTVSIDNEKIYRNVGYMFKVIITFNDNEKVYEYESEYSEIMKMDGTEFPTISFEENQVTFERIEGTIIVSDPGNTIDVKNNGKLTVIYTDSVGNSKSFTSDGSLKIPVSINNLRANETYKFSVYARVNLQDDNDTIDNCYIGGAIVKTKEPNNMKANFRTDTSSTSDTFSVSMQLKMENEQVESLEAQTLTGITFSIYSGQTTEGQMPTGSPKKSVKLVDKNLKEYESELKEKYFDNSVKITPAFFGSQNNDFKDQYYTIVVTSAYDYTEYKNVLPILQNIYTVKTNGYMPDLPEDVNNAVNVEVIRNRDIATPRDDLDASTIVEYKIKANYNNTGLYAKKVIYKAYNAITGELIQTKSELIDETGEIPTVQFAIEDGQKENETSSTNLTRGNTYFFSYQMELDLDKNGESDTLYPYTDDGTLLLRSRDQTPEKQETKIVMYPVSSTDTTYTIAYKCSDIDNALDGNFMIVKLGDRIIQNKEIENIGSDQYQQVTFDNLTKTNLNVYIKQRLICSETSTIIDMINQKFEGINKLNDVSYKISLESNKVVITLNDITNQIEKIAALKVVFTTTDGTKTFTKDLLKPSNNAVNISLNELEEFRSKETRVTVSAYYDSGITGYNLEVNHYVTYQKASLQGEETSYYTIINGKLVDTTNIIGNIYTSIRQDNQISIYNAFNSKLKVKDLILDTGITGFRYQGDVILQKQIDEQKLSCSGDNIIHFDLIVTGISLLDSNEELTISAELDKMFFKADLYTTSLVKDNKIYIDIYKTDENGKNSELVKTVTKTTDEFNSIVEIEGLAPKTFYFIKFRTIIKGDNGSETEQYLYDMDYEVEGKQYYFSTMADVGLDNIAVKYNPISYNSKTIDISYNLDKIIGYQRIRYQLKKYNKETNLYEDFGDKIEDDNLMKKDMLKKLNANPDKEGVKFVFGEKYKIIISPIADYTNPNGETQEIELGTKEFVFTLANLTTPVIALKGSIVEDNAIEYSVTIYDRSKIIQNGNYTIKILEDEIDVTPKEYKNITFSIGTYNKKFKITNIKQNTKYKIVVTTQLDYNNDAETFEEYDKDYVKSTSNKYGIIIGDVSTSSLIDVNIYKIGLTFNNSYKLNEINNIKYSIYNINGYSRTGTTAFIPTVTSTATGDIYYQYTLNEELDVKEQGTYYIEIQFYKDENLVDGITLAHVYLGQ